MSRNHFQLVETKELRTRLKEGTDGVRETLGPNGEWEREPICCRAHLHTSPSRNRPTGTALNDIESDISILSSVGDYWSA